MWLDKYALGCDFYACSPLGFTGSNQGKDKSQSNHKSKDSATLSWLKSYRAKQQFKRAFSVGADGKHTTKTNKGKRNKNSKNNRSTKSKSQVYCAAKDQMIIGHTFHNKRVSLAALLSFHFEHLVVAIALDEERVWVCVILSGKVLTENAVIPDVELGVSDSVLSGDMILSKALADSVMKSLIGYCQDYAARQSQDLVIIQGADGVDTLQCALAKTSPKVIKQCTLRAPSHRGWVLPVALSVVVAAVSLGVYQYRAYQDEVAQSLLFQEQAKLNQLRANAEAEQAKLGFMAQFNALNAYVILNEITKTLKMLSYLTQGWQLVQLNYQAKYPNELQLTYQRQHYSSVNQLMKLKDALNTLGQDTSSRTDFTSFTSFSVLAVEVDQSYDKAKLTIGFDAINSADKRSSYAVEQITQAKLLDRGLRQSKLSELVDAFQVNGVNYQLSGVGDLSILSNIAQLGLGKDQASLLDKSHLKTLISSGKGDAKESSKTIFLRLIQALKSSGFVVTDELTMQFSPEVMGQLIQYQFKGVVYA
ncbi:hypothetical protein [Cysteiniphilum marinum]|uniref:hypothetical protein n=1 Tax=Cysteiniphilum marinum TaxID=2774191 RepID=UPI0019397558|nr:hypothetical protein [Cysteiniphilum marinum]